MNRQHGVTPWIVYIKDLKVEATFAGDEAQAALCDLALKGDVNAYNRCLAAIRATRAMDEPSP